MLPEASIRELFEGFDGAVGLYVSVPHSGERFVMNEDRQFYSASTIKVPILCRLFADAEAGLLNLSEKITVREENRCGGSGILQLLSPDLEISFFDLAVLMITVSDNIATNELISRLGMERVNAFCAESGLSRTWLHAKMMAAAKDRPAGLAEGLPVNATTAADLGGLLEKMAKGAVVCEEACRRMVRIMAGQQLGRLRAKLPCFKPELRGDTLPLPPEGRVLAATKGGTKDNLGCIHDTGIFYLPDGRYYVVSAFTESSRLTEAEQLLRQLGVMLFEALR